MSIVNTDFGSFLIGLVFVVVLFGILTVQTVSYYNNFPRDPKWLHFWVALVFLVHLLQVIFMSKFFYHYILGHWTDPAFLAHSNWVIPLTAGLETSAEFLTQMYFARRAFVLNKGWWRSVAVLAAIASTSTFAMGLVSAWKLGTFSEFSKYGQYWDVTYWFVGNVVTDILVTVPVAISLYKGKGSFSSTNRIIQEIVVWVISTGILTSTVQIVVLILYFIQPKNFIFFVVSYILASLYGNSLLAFLNRRSAWGTGKTLHVSAPPHPKASYAMNNLNSIPGNQAPKSRGPTISGGVLDDVSTSQTHLHRGTLDDIESVGTTVPTPEEQDVSPATAAMSSTGSRAASGTGPDRTPALRRSVESGMSSSPGSGGAARRSRSPTSATARSRDHPSGVHSPVRKGVVQVSVTREEQ